MLLHAFHDICATGWKCDNGTFRAGDTSVLERHMVAIFPGCDLKAKPQIESKIKTWKKQYSWLSSALMTSGVGWNDTERCLDIQDDDVWDNYVKVI